MPIKITNFQFQLLVVLIAIVLFAIKLIAWYLTQSVAILSDALESIVNIVSAIIGLYSLRLSAKPRDINHPYGHGKIEFLSAGIEGSLIMVAGGFIIYEAIVALFYQSSLLKLDDGILLVAATGIVNYGIGYWSIKRGKSNHSMVLVASGQHLQSDTYTTLGIVLGLVLVQLTGWWWLDSIVALIFASIIIVTGARIIRKALAGMMDEADDTLLEKVVSLLQKHRTNDWIDIHNLRIIKYGGILHFDCHLTLPWYFDVNEAHDEVDKLEDLIKDNFGNHAEMFVHVDGCKPFSCQLCLKQNCSKRQKAFKAKIDWTIDNVRMNQRHRLG